MSKKILICDDDEGIIDVTQVILEDEYDVHTLQDSREFFEKIEEIQPDLVLLDLWMPNVSGDVITEKMKAAEEYKYIPIIVISASKETEEVANKVGADDFLCKPFDVDVLLQKIQKHIG